LSAVHEYLFNIFAAILRTRRTSFHPQPEEAPCRGDKGHTQHGTFGRYYRKKWEYNGMVHQLFIDFKKAYDSVKREVLYNILLEFGIPKKLVRLIKMCLNKTYSKVRVGKNLSDTFPI
jgi:hypothetical protein